MELKETINKKILTLDGGMGTMLQMEKLEEDDFRGNDFKDHPVSLKGLNDLLVLTQPEIVKNIHREYLDAGADIITANSFNANYYGLKDYSMESYVHKINFQAIKIAKDVTAQYNKKNPNKPRFVAATLGPTGKTASLSPNIDNPAYRDVTFDDLVEAYKHQAQGMVDAGADILMVETVFDTLNAKAALYAINQVRSGLSEETPVMISGTIDESGRNLSGQTIEAFYNSVFPFSLFSIGLNCSFGADKMTPYLERLSVKSKCYVSAHPNAGFPNELGEYDQSPEEMAEQVEVFCEKGLVNIVGGCCGSKPEHIEAINKMVEKYSPRQSVKHPRTTRVSGLQSFGVKDSTRMVKVGERTNVNGSKKFAKLIRNEKFEEAFEIARNQIRDGAEMLNINLDDSMIDSKEVMKTFLNHLTAEPDIINMPIMLDSSDFDVIENGLKCLQGRSLVNSISIKDGEEDFKKKASVIKELGAVVVVMAFDEKGQAETFDRKTEICRRAYNILIEEVGFQPEDIIFDPNVLTIGTGIEAHNDYAVDFINSVKWIKENLPYAKVNAGVSNVSFAFRGNDYLRDVINSVFVHHCEKAGLDFAIVNPAKIIDYDNIDSEVRGPVEDLVLNKRADATDRLVDLAAKTIDKSTQQKHKDKWREQSPEERVVYSLCNGINSYINEDIQELRDNQYSSLNIIQGPLMDGMNKVGELFADGEMFLPQVIKSARIMNKAVEFLSDDIEKETKANTKQKGQKKKVLLATVEGDVHDIGKNIVALVLRCNNYEVIDLGVMVPNKEIIKAIDDEKPDILGLSGLISPSLDKMIGIVKRLEDKGCQIPVLLGGAATSALHTAVKVAPLYSGVVAHVPNAMQSISMASKVFSYDGEAGIEEIREIQNKLRKEFRKKKTTTKFLSLEDARRKKYVLERERPVKPRMLGVKEFNDFEIEDLRKYIDWTPYFNGWGLKGSYPSIFEKEREGREAERLFKEALAMLDEIQENELIQPNGIIGLFPANSKGDDILIFRDESRRKIAMRIPMLRQQNVKDKEGYALSLADFVAPVDSGIRDYFGGFAVTTGHGIDKHLRRFEENGDSYKSIMFRLIADRLVEAAAEVMHMWVRKKYWGYVPNENLSLQELIKGKYQGIRPAVGYPACPDHRLKGYLFDLLNVEERIGISLTSIYAMKPASSVAGFYMAHNASRYFGIGKIGKDQVSDYAQRTNKDIEKTKKWLYFAIDDKK